MTTLAVLLLLLALPGLLLVRTATLVARWCALLALLAIAAALWVPPLVESTTVPGAFAAVTTADAPVLPGAMQPGPAADAPRLLGVVSAATAGLPTALASAQARARRGTDRMHVVWDGEATLTPAASAAVDGAFTTVPALAFAPDGVQVLFSVPPQVGRPTMVSLALPELPAGLPVQGLLVIGDRELARRPLAAATRALDLSWTPEQTGELPLLVAIDCGGHRVQRRGTIHVATPPAVLVVEPAGVLAAALRAQGVHVVAAPELPVDLAPFAAFVVATALDVPTQERLVAAVADGRGLLAALPALPPRAQPLHAFLPIRRPGELPAAGDGPAGDQPGTEPRSQPPEPEPPASDPPPSERPPIGDTSQATPDPAGPTEVDKHAVAMMLVIDRSGSMGEPLGLGATKMSYAMTSALGTARRLDPGDALGLVTFGNKNLARVVLPLTPVGDPRIEPAIAQLRSLPNEQTYLLDGVRKAAAELRGSKAAVRHVVVISDGEFYGEDQSLLAEAARIRKDGITLGVISFIDRNTQSGFKARAEQLARAGGGLFTASEDPSKVPIHVSAEVVRALDRVGRRPRTDADGPGTGDLRAPPRQPEVAQDDPPKPPPPEPAPAVTRTPQPTPEPRRLPVRAVARSPLLEPVPHAGWPTLGEAVATTAPLDAQVLLVVGDDGLPLLAFGNRGLGRVAALAVDPASPAAAEFLADPAFPARLSQWVAAVLPLQPRVLSSAALGPPGIEPPAPTPAVADTLGALAGGSLRPVAEFVPPSPQVELVHRSQLPDWAIVGVLGLLVLAVVERLTALRAARG